MEINGDTVRLVIATGDARRLAQACNALGVIFEHSAPNIGQLFTACADMITRQQLLLEQANLVPRQEFSSGSRH